MGKRKVSSSLGALESGASPLGAAGLGRRGKSNRMVRWAARFERYGELVRDSLANSL